MPSLNLPEVLKGCGSTPGLRCPIGICSVSLMTWALVSDGAKPIITAPPSLVRCFMVATGEVVERNPQVPSSCVLHLKLRLFFRLFF